MNIIKRAFNHGLIKNSFIFLIGTFVANIGNFFLHLIMSRLMDVKTFGEFEALISLLYIISVPSATLMTMVIKFTSEFKANDDEEKIKVLFSTFTRVLLFWSIVIFVIFVALSAFIADFMQLDSSMPIILLGVIMLFSFFEAISGGIQNGLQKFFMMSWLAVLNVSLKIAFATLLLKLSFGVNGAIGAFSLATIVTYFIGLVPIRKYISWTKENLKEMKQMTIFLLPTFVMLLSLNFYYNIDVILVKYFFDPNTAGQYGAISIIGRIVFYLSGAIVTVMFPMLSRAIKDGSQNGLMKLTGILVGISAFGVLLVYYFIPELVVQLFVGEKYLMIAPYIVWFGLAMLFYSYINSLSRYFLANNITRSLYIFAAGLAGQILALALFHETLGQVILVMNISLGVILITLYTYYLKIKFDSYEKVVNNNSGL